MAEGGEGYLRLHRLPRDLFENVLDKHNESAKTANSVQSWSLAAVDSRCPASRMR